jgi:nicotinamide-nucleotide amidase
VDDGWTGADGGNHQGVPESSPAPPQRDAPTRDADDLAEELGDILARRGERIAVAESLTGGLLVQALAKISGSGEWLAGSIVAYASDVKHDLLGVAAEKVVSREAAEQMAAGARDRLGADVALSVTGVAGPSSQDGEPPGTVWIGSDDGTSATATLFTTSGSPEEICMQTVEAALGTLLDRLRAG